MDPVHSVGLGQLESQAGWIPREARIESLKKPDAVGAPKVSVSGGHKEMT